MVIGLAYIPPPNTPALVIAIVIVYQDVYGETVPAIIFAIAVCNIYPIALVQQL